MKKFIIAMLLVTGCSTAPKVVEQPKAPEKVTFGEDSRLSIEIACNQGLSMLRLEAQEICKSSFEFINENGAKFVEPIPNGCLFGLSVGLIKLRGREQAHAEMSDPANLDAILQVIGRCTKDVNNILMNNDSTI